ncbi:LysR family transcriptional regulator [uncultured Massilia sp.]|uniref:LysR family transcriptional regulator n=1 Tax=uncultured Massilia sp. TaxID=169973 RepID=UPI002600C8F0|nr:LysR family transcriptional regulator [uncultured Massilia sp.]
MNAMTSASLQDILGFVAVAQTGSFTAAAERLGTNKSSVGKAVQRLEKHLGTRLFQRTTRAVRLTEDGETYLAAARGALERLREAEQALGALRARYPKVTVEMTASDRMSDPVGDGWDIVIRIGNLPADSEMTVRKICDLKLALYAAPSYLERRGAVASIADLDAHDPVLFRSITGQVRGWSLNDKGQRRELMPAPTLVVGDGRTLVEAATLGLGIAQLVDRFAAPAVAAGRLVHLLPEADVATTPVHALIPVGRRMTAKTRVVLEHLVETLQR